MTVNSQSGPITKSSSNRPPDDLIATAASALRRFHFKTGRNATKTSNSTKNQASSSSSCVPKVIIMGSSTTSTETTTNTSTDSANTIVTTVTMTDDNDSSLEQVDDDSTTESSLMFMMTDNNFAILQPITASPSSSPVNNNDKSSTPPITCIINEAKKFTFDDLLLMETAEVHHNDVIINDDNNEKEEKVVKKRSFRRKLEVGNEEKFERTSPNKRRASEDHNSSSASASASALAEKTDNMNKETVTHFRHKKSATRRHSTSTASSSASASASASSTNNNKNSIIRTKNGNKKKFVPDVRVDHIFSDEAQKPGHLSSSSISFEKRGSVCLNKCLREVGAELEIYSTTSSSSATTSPINVTENPMHFSSPNRKPPQATIVVQQASLSSLDPINNTITTSTILLNKNNGGNDFLNITKQHQQTNNNKEKFNKFNFTSNNKEENLMKHHLLDVANNLTLEEIHDFEMRYGSPHHNRSQSVKTPGRPNYLCLPQQRSRVASMPNTGVEEEYYRLRHFSITGKGVVNRGDSLKSRRSRSNNSVASSNSSTEQIPAAVSAAGSARTSASCSLASSRESSTSAPPPAPFRVLMLGGPAVGKSSLVSQFMTSEYLHAYDTSIDDESGEKSVSVLLAGEESELTFIDFATMDLSPDTLIKKYTDPHAYAVVYSSSDRASFDCAEKILQNLWSLDTIGTKAVILVSNKADLVRSKAVTTEEGKLMATSYDCKYIETSVGINHNVDELLVGILTQIRLKLENPERSRDLFRKRSCSKKNFNRNKSPSSSAVGGTGDGTPIIGSAQNSPKKYRGSRTSASLKVRTLLGKVWTRDSKSKSCENLHVL